MKNIIMKYRCFFVFLIIVVIQSGGNTKLVKGEALEIAETKVQNNTNMVSIHNQSQSYQKEERSFLGLGSEPKHSLSKMFRTITCVECHSGRLPKPENPHQFEGGIPKYHLWDILNEDSKVDENYGLYTYVLFGRKVDNLHVLDTETIGRYQSLIDAIKISTLSVIEARWQPKEQSNIFYIPSIETVNDKMVTLNDYDSTLAMNYLVLLNKAIDDLELKQQVINNPGPFLISTRQPIGQHSNITAIFIADLSKTHHAAMKEIISTYKRYVVNNRIDDIELFYSMRLALLNYVLHFDKYLRIAEVKLGSLRSEK